MSDIYTNLRCLAKSIRVQNLFTAVKEIHTLKLFKNIRELSNLQQYYLSLIYMYDALYKDIASENVSKKIMDSDLYADCYILWKKEKENKHIDTPQLTGKDVRLVPAKTIKFNK